MSVSIMYGQKMHGFQFLCVNGWFSKNTVTFDFSIYSGLIKGLSLHK